MHVVITGGAGFIGSHLAKYHLSKGDSVHVIDDLSTGHLDSISSIQSEENFTFDEADIVTWKGLPNALKAADRVYHMAAIVGVRRVLENPVAVIDTNMGGTERILKIIVNEKLNPELLIASSSEVYGFNENPEFNERDDFVLRSGSRLRWCYAVTKLADEFLAFSYYYHYKLNISIARLFNTVGPGQRGRYGMVFPNFVKQAVSGQPLTIFGEGSQTRSFCDVRDTVVALDLLAGSKTAYGQAVNVGNNQEITIKDLAMLIRDRAKSNSPLTYLSYEEAYGKDFEDITHRRPGMEKLCELTGFQPKWKLEDTIDTMIRQITAESEVI